MRLPSERTLQDYTHYVEAKQGFDPAIDKLLIEAVKVQSCPEREKCVLLILDEMHIREQLIFDKHSGAFVGFAHLSDIVDHLAKFEQEMSNEEVTKTRKDDDGFHSSVACNFRMHNFLVPT